MEPGPIGTRFKQAARLRLAVPTRDGDRPMAATRHDTGPFVHLITWLEDHSVPFDLHDHSLAYTASATAHAEGVSERSFAKVVGVRTADGTRLLAVVDASDRVDLVRLAAFLGTDWVTLLTEHELDEILPDCPGGTIPPIPEIARVDVVADEAVRAGPQISFHAGSHRTSVRVDRQAWERAAGIRYGSLAMTAEAAVG
jgi:Ala-tRNA(Pro) deacylase